MEFIKAYGLGNDFIIKDGPAIEFRTRERSCGKGLSVCAVMCREAGSMGGNVEPKPSALNIEWTDGVIMTDPARFICRGEAKP